MASNMGPVMGETVAGAVLNTKDPPS